MPRLPAFRPLAILAVSIPWLAGCAGSALTDHDCMMRVMYFESNRSSTEGMLAVGTTVMNRLDSPRYPKSVCAVVGQPRQFAPGVLDKPMNPREAVRAAAVADRVLAGERHPGVGEAMFFHTAGLTFPYTNMHYVLVAGGNAFYEKRSGSDRGAPDQAASADAASQTPQVVPEPPPEPSVEAVAEAADGAVADQD